MRLLLLSYLIDYTHLSEVSLACFYRSILQKNRAQKRLHVVIKNRNFSTEGSKLKVVMLLCSSLGTQLRPKQIVNIGTRPIWKKNPSGVAVGKICACWCLFRLLVVPLIFTNCSTSPFLLSSPRARTSVQTDSFIDRLPL